MKLIDFYGKPEESPLTQVNEAVEIPSFDEPVEYIALDRNPEIEIPSEIEFKENANVDILVIK